MSATTEDFTAQTDAAQAAYRRRLRRVEALIRKAGCGLLLTERDGLRELLKIVKPLSPDAAAMGRKGGLKGGRTLAAKLTPEQRSESARRAARARWAAP